LNSYRQSRSWLKATRDSFERRYGHENECLETLYGPLLAHPLLYPVFGAKMLLPGHNLAKAKAVISDFLSANLENEVVAPHPPARLNEYVDCDIERAQQQLLPFMQCSHMKRRL
jgi:hypothetical protein